ncbi:unnamed protein product [Blepharisma stoltei]|uniref:TNFR-Cys domain-containing protein n=1 Tax=Blepharisma stoltei TaxID=1481888 RepID=A0AAU9KPJ4_9CILI|nr:unnamed protein product [Blepharisma stoltei]
MRVKFYLLIASLLQLAISQCCIFCDSSSCAVPCTLCSTGYSLIGNLLCVETCPSNSVFSSTPIPSCSSPFGQVFTIDFTTQKDLTAKTVASFSNLSNLQFGDSNQNTPLPTVDRGFYFASTSAIENSNIYIPSYLFTMNIWIFPISFSGVIFYAKIGTLEYIKIETLSGNYHMSLLLKNQLDSGNSVLASIQGLALSNSWEGVTFQFTQTAYNSIDLQIIINNTPHILTISGREANFPNGSYDWVIGHPTNSFQGFIYWIQVNSDNTINFPSINPPTCLNSYFWGGSNCQLCSGSCQSWPWCIRSENCLVCKSLDCTACNGYETSMCTSCNTGLVPGCCDALCDACSQTWSCNTCKAGKFLIGGICLNSCPYGFGSCAVNPGIFISTDFNVPFAGSYGIFNTGTDSSSYQFFNSPETIDPVPTQNRGLYFTSGKYLAGAIDLSHTFTISLWIRPQAGDILGNSYGNLKVSSAGLATLLLISWDNTSTASLSNSVSISTSSWNYLSFSVSFSNKQTSLIVYSNNSPSAPNSISNYVFRPSSNDKLFIGKSVSNNYNGFVSYFKLWGGIINDFSGEMGDGGCGSGNGISCLWNCGFLFWGSACTACDGGCTLGCVLNGNCNICNDNLCGICSSFNSGSCSQCITNAAGNPCACNTGYYKPNGLSICSLCSTSCIACSGPGYYSCTACSSGTYLLRGICMTSCPSKYSQDSVLNKCIQITNLVVEATFNEIILLDKISDFQVGLLNNNVYPSYDVNDPVPSYNRGYYFKSSSYLTSTGIYMSPFLSLNFWVYPISGGALFRKTSTTTYISISITGAGIPSAFLTLSDSSSINISGTSSVLNNWKYLSIVGLVFLGKTNLIIYINNALVSSSLSSNLAYLKDLGSMYIGNASGGFVGFLWSFSAYNDETQYSTDWNTAGCGGAQCPNGIIFPMCSFLKYLDTSTSTCTNCLSGCTGGCRNSISCGLCRMPACNSCLSFSGPCTSCVSNASPDGNGGCVCKNSYFWYPETLSCSFCDRYCKTCLGTTFYECSVCYSGSTLVGLICLPGCPYGFGSGCSPVSTPVINELFNSGLLTTYGPFKTKIDSTRYNFFKTLDSYDSATSAQRGLLLTQNTYLQADSLWLNHDISVGVWVNTLIHGNLVSYFITYYNYDFVFSTDASLLYQISNGWATKIKFSTNAAIVPNDAWNYLSFTMNYGYNSVQINAFVNGVPTYTITRSGAIYRPLFNAGSLRINAYYNCFVGYIYSFQLWNVLVTDFSSWINDNICGLGLASLCLSPYTLASYNDATNCSTCDNSLTGCPRNVFCNQCADPLCASCTNFSPGSCTKCVGFSSDAPSQACACIDGYFIRYNYICLACPAGCKKCLSFIFNSCTSCFSGYYLNSGMCISKCPSGYTMNSLTNTCDISGSTLFFSDFYNLIKLDAISSLKVGNIDTNKYPIYDSNDPWPAINRGYYFSGNSSISTTYMIGTSFTISLWLKVFGGGYLMAKYVSDYNFQLSIKNTGQAYFNCTFSSFWTSVWNDLTSSSSLLNSWNLISATASLNSDTSQISNIDAFGSTTVNLYVNGAVDCAPKTAMLSYLKDNPSGLLFIGSSPSMNNGFTGFVDRITIYPDSLSYGLDYANSGCNGSCSKCPSSLVCLSECLINTYPGASCGNCLSYCAYGCRNGLTCRLCKQSTCLSCEEFTGDCFSCIPNAYLEYGSCYCDTDAYFNETTQNCQTCSAAGYFLCTTCNFAVGNLCIRECPYGFTSPHCKNVTNPVIDQTFYGDFAGSYSIFITGASLNTYQFWNSPESADPIPAYKRGLYFSSGKYIYSSAEVYLSHSFSVGTWIYSISNGDIIYKETYAALSSNGSLKILLEDLNEAVTPIITPAISNPPGWNHISFTVISSITATSITIYSNNEAVTPITVNGKIFRDQASKTLYIGKSTTATFQGFIYWFTLWNVPITDFSSQVNNLCGTGLGKSCLWTCDINNYYTGSSCSSCNSCSLGCRRSQNCNICYDLLCDTCSGFDSGECINCVSNATPSAGVCACNTNYLVSGDGLSCNWACTIGCASCTGYLVYNQCITCKSNYYLLNNQCFSSCPAGYTQDTSLNQCTNPPATPIISLALQNLIYLDSVDDFTVGSSSDPYPSFDAADPIPSISRGYYFSSGKYMTSAASLIISPWFTITIWARPISQGNIISQLNGSVLLMVASVSASGYINFIVQLQDSSAITLTGTENLFGAWHNIAFCSDIVNGYSIASYILDGSSISNLSSTNKQPFMSLGQITIGKQSISDSFTGFLWSLKIYNDNLHSLSEWIGSGCSSGCTNCPSEKICPDSCEFGKFYSSSCSDCLGSCSTYGCRSALTCRLCKQKECFSCTKFDGDCTSCIASASLNSGNCACNPNSIWIQSSETCEICDILCSSCAGSYFFECTSCVTAKTLVGAVCLHQCPTGFSNSGCTSTSSPIVDTSFYGTFKGNYGIFEAGENSNTYYFFNSPENDDPIPATHRGLYFSNGKFLKSSVSLYLSTSFSLGLWVLVKSAGDFLEKENGFIINSSGKLVINLQSPLQLISSLATLPMSLDGWSYLSISVDYLNGDSIITTYIDNIPSIPIISGNKIFRDSTASNLIFGKSSSNALFSGFLYWVTIWNSAINNFSAQIDNLCGAGMGRSCLWNCDISQFYTGAACESCSTCSFGCRRLNSCNICYDPLCKICSFFSAVECSGCEGHTCDECDGYPSACIACKENASLIGLSCQCNTGFSFNKDSEICEGCDIYCKTCVSFDYFKCLTCIDGFYLFSGVCLSPCPLGFSPSGNQCVKVKEKIFDLDLNTLEGIIYDKASSIPVVSGSTKQFYPNYEADDPIAAYLRGFYFNGQSSVLRLPDYSNFTSPKLLIAPVFTISIWLNPEAPFSSIMSKHSNSDSSTIWAVYLMANSPALFLIMNSSPILYTSKASLSEYKWNHIAFSLQITSKQDCTISSYVNGVSDSSMITVYGYFRDRSLDTALIIGAQASPEILYNFFQGFIYTIQIFNAIIPISGLSTAVCTESCGVCPTDEICIPNCKINEFWSGPSYNACSLCDIKCTKSCRNWTCSLCNDLLCEDCIDYSETGCVVCKENAKNPDSCVCDIDFVIDSSNNSTCIPIKSGGFRGPDGHFYSCPNLCSACESLTKCIICVENARLSNGLCYCTLGYNGISNCTLVDFSAKLTASDDNSLYLTFSDDLASDLEADDFIIKIKNYEISWKFEKVNNTCYYITLSFEHIISSGTLASLVFLDLTKLRSVSNGILNSYELSVSLNYYDPAPYLTAIEAVTSQTIAGTQSIISIATALSIINPSPSSLWSLMNTLQILSYLTLSGIPLSSKMSAFLNSLNSFNLLPNAFIYFIDKNEGNTPYSQAEKFGFDSNLILINQGNDFTFILVSISPFPIVLLLSRCSYRWFGKKFKKTIRSYKYSFYLRFWIQCYLELGAAASIGLVSFCQNNPTQIINIILCLLVYLFLVFTPPLFFLLSYRYKNKILLGEKTFHSLFGTFFYEFRTEKGLLATQYYLIFFARRLIYIINLVYLRDYPKTEVTINAVLSLMTIIHLLFCWPFKDPILQITNLFTEILVFIVMMLSSIYLFNTEQEIITGIESSMVIIVAIAIAVQFSSSVAIFVRTLYQVIRSKYGKIEIANNDENPAYKAVN